MKNSGEGWLPISRMNSPPIFCIFETQQNKNINIRRNTYYGFSS